MLRLNVIRSKLISSPFICLFIALLCKKRGYTGFALSFHHSVTLSDENFFITLFSGTVRLRRLKFGTQLDNGWLYRVYRNPAAAIYLSLHFFIFFSLQFSNIKKFCYIFLRNQNQAAAAYPSLYFFIFSFSPIFKH